MKLMTSKLYPILIARWQLGLCCVLMLISLAWGCAVAPKTLSVKDRSQSFEATSFEAGTIISTKTGQPISFEALVSDLAASRVIYVGERHTDRSHHEIQLKIIKDIFEKHPSMAVGMEMFDHSYQKVLDQWSNAELDEKIFLRKTHWYANWRYSFSLYRDILNFIKDNRIRLVGLNVPFHIPSKIRVGGIENLRDEEKRHLPSKIDTDVAAHRTYVENVFNGHHFKGMVEFDDFYMAQCVWEETMAQAVAENLNDNVMVVIAGGGHIQYGYGIPDRAFRRSKADFRTVFLAGVGGETDLGIADFIWVTP